MAYIYLLNLHETIDNRLNEARKSIGNGSNDIETSNFLNGRINVLKEFKNFLTAQLNPKLPRRIRNRLKDLQ